jgi:hypothetical protein
MPGILALYDLNEVCKGKNYTPFGDNLKKLQDLSLLQPDGKPHESIRNVVLSAVQGEGLDMHLGSPVADQSQAENLSKNVRGMEDLIGKILESKKDGTPDKGRGGR